MVSELWQDLAVFRFDGSVFMLTLVSASKTAPQCERGLIRSAPRGAQVMIGLCHLHSFSLYKARGWEDMRKVSLMLLLFPTPL